MLGGLILIAVVAIGLLTTFGGSVATRTSEAASRIGAGLPDAVHPGAYQARMQAETSGFRNIMAHIPRWEPDASLEEISDVWRKTAPQAIEEIDRVLPSPGNDDSRRLDLLCSKFAILNSEGETSRAYEVLGEMRSWAEKNDEVAAASLYTIIFSQGVVALRRGETENCVMCRGESSCILPIAPAAVHTNPTGSRLAIRHFTEYLQQFPDDLEARWLLNLAHMTLGEHPDKVDPRYLVRLDHFLQSEFNIGKFRDIGHQVGVDRFNMAGGAVLEDFDSDGRLDLAVTSFDPTLPMAYYHNAGDGTFTDRTKEAGLTKQLGGKYLVQTDYNNDGRMDLFVSRGAWFPHPMRQSLLRNDGNGTFSDVTQQAGLLHAVNSTSSSWADYDNDGWLDIFATCYEYEMADVVKGLLGQPHDAPSNRLFRNVNGKRFENKTKEAGLDLVFATMGSNFGDFDNDGFLDFYLGTGDPDLSTLVPNRMFKNVAGRRFAEITASAGTGNLQKGHGVSCADWDNDGDVDIFIEMGGAVAVDKYHNILFQNPGQGNHWLTVKLVGKKTNRAAIGARIKVVTADVAPLTVHRHVSSGSSWGANPLHQHIGLGKSKRVAALEIHWPTSGTTQVFRDIVADQAIEVTELADTYRALNWKPIPLAK